MHCDAIICYRDRILNYHSWEYLPILPIAFFFTAFQQASPSLLDLSLIVTKTKLLTFFIFLFELYRVYLNQCIVSVDQ